MTHRELYLWTRQALSEAGIEDPGVEAMVLFGHFFSLDRGALAVHGAEETDPARETLLREAVARRQQRTPLQYILGSWEFMGLALAVGPGVLCLREDTAVLVEAAAQELAGLSAPVGADLCAGTGAVGLGVCSRIPEARVTCVELSEEAFPYLEKNAAAYPRYRVTARLGDVLDPATAEAFGRETLDFLVSNPPYVRRGEIPSLQPEVRQEPLLALDGGGDGLVFYRALCAHWLGCLKPGGLLGVEIGEDQGEAVCRLFAAAGLQQIEVRKDWAGLDRAVLGRKTATPRA